MFSLLFISDRPKVDSLIKLLQPGLRSKIVVASNYDYGVKHVFEQKISMVAIQSRIGEASCEGVVRHIRNLLGSDAPSFILMNEDSRSVKPDPGLFDQVLDLAQSERSLVAAFFSFITPEALGGSAGGGAAGGTVAAPAEVAVGEGEAYGEPDGGSGMVVEQYGFPSVLELEEIYPEEPEPAAREQESWVTSAAEWEAAAGVPAYEGEPSVAVDGLPAAKDRPDIPQPGGDGRVQGQGGATASVAAGTTRSTPGGSAAVAARLPAAETPVAEDFGVPLDADFFREDVDERRRSGSPRGRLIRLAAGVVLFAGIGAGGWFLVEGRLALLPPSGPGKPAGGAGAQGALPKVALHPIVRSPEAVPVPAASAPPAAPAPAVSQPQSQPAFLASASRDFAYSATHPGWERYLGEECEFRVFRGGTRIKALQVMVLPGAAIGGGFLDTVLTKMLGNGRYTVSSEERQGRTVVQTGNVGPSADLLIYRALRSGAIRAFVVSIN